MDLVEQIVVLVAKRHGHLVLSRARRPVWLRVARRNGIHGVPSAPSAKVGREMSRDLVVLDETANDVDSVANLEPFGVQVPSRTEAEESRTSSPIGMNGWQGLWYEKWLERQIWNRVTI